jgi:hypothetical protein
MTDSGLAAALVWIPGVKLTGYAKTIADRTGADQAFVGILLLGAVVSLPEMATTVSAAALGDARLAQHTGRQVERLLRRTGKGLARELLRKTRITGGLTLELSSRAS